MLQSEPEVRVFLDHLGIIADGSPQVTRLFQQQGTVEEGHQVVGFQFQHEVKVLNTPIVITHLGTQQSSVVMTQEVIGIEVEGRIIIRHRTSQVVLIITSHRTVDVVHGLFRHQVDALVEIFFTLFPFLTCQTDDGALSPDATIVGIEFQTLLKGCHRLRGILLKQIDLRLHRIGSCVFRPMGQHRINLCQSQIVVLILYQTEDAVMPKPLIMRIIAKGLIVVLHSIGIFLQVDAAEATQLIGIHHIGIPFDSHRTVAFRTTVVVEIIFRHPSEEPGFEEPGFLTDGLIEVLDGKHIVLIEEGRAPHHHQAVGIELGH